MIKSLHVRNFKSLLDLNVSFDPITVVIGGSGTGKSNLVQAVALLQTLVRTGAHDQKIMEALARFGGADAIRPANLGNSEFRIEWDMVFDRPGVDGDFRYFLAIKFSPPGQQLMVAEKLQHAGSTLFDQANKRWNVEPKLATVPPAIGVMLGWLSGAPEINLAYLTIVRGIASFDFPGDVLTRSVTATETGYQGLHANGANYQSVIDSIAGNIRAMATWRDIEESLKVLSNSLTGITTTPNQPEQVSVAFEFGGKTVSLGLSKQSEGFRRFLAHLLAIYQNTTPQTIIFEEPEKGIFPGALTLLAEHIKTASEKLGIQFILTTHSPQLLDAFDGESIRNATVSARGTEITPLASSDILALREQLMDPGELLTKVDPMPAQAVEG